MRGMRRAKQLVRRAMDRLGFPSGPPDVPGAPARTSVEGALANMKKLGFVPDLVIDVGAAYGDFTRMCANLFPDARFLLFEPLEEYAGELDLLAREHPRATWVNSAAAGRPGTRRIHVHPDLVGSSFLLEPEEKSDVNGLPREVTTTTIDAEMEGAVTSGPLLLKADVQGAELDVLSGAPRTLEASEVVILETTLFNTFERGPLFHEVVAYMAARGFCVYDLIGNLYRPLDGALMQMDVIFVSRSSALRRYHTYATAEQRRAQTEAFSRRGRAPARRGGNIASGAVPSGTDVKRRAAPLQVKND